MKSRKQVKIIICSIVLIVLLGYGIISLVKFIDIKSRTVSFGDGGIKILVNDDSPNFSEPATSDEGIYAMEDEYGISYYYRGAVENNYVKFGKYPDEIYRGYYNYSGNSRYKEYSSMEDCESDTETDSCEKSYTAGKDMYWRIIRFNGNGTVRLIYDGIEAHENGDIEDDRTLFYDEKYNLSNNDAKYVGYMYGETLETISTNKEEAQSNDIDSQVKKILDKWYESYLLNTEYEKYVSDEVFCNDRSVADEQFKWDKEDYALGYGNKQQFFGASNRINNSNPTFKCNMNDAIDANNDKFSKDGAKGNGKLRYPIGLITADEVIAAGGNTETENTNYYLYKGKGYMTMTPYSWFYCAGASIYTVAKNGSIKNHNVEIEKNISPVINLSTEFVSNAKGSGLIDDPYRIE